MNKLCFDEKTYLDCIHSNRAQLKKNQQSSFYTATTDITSQIQNNHKDSITQDMQNNKSKEIDIRQKHAHCQHLHAYQDTNTWNQSTKSPSIN